MIPEHYPKGYGHGRGMRGYRSGRRIASFSDVHPGDRFIEISRRFNNAINIIRVTSLDPMGWGRPMFRCGFDYPSYRYDRPPFKVVETMSLWEDNFNGGPHAPYELYEAIPIRRHRKPDPSARPLFTNRKELQP